MKKLSQAVAAGLAGAFLVSAAAPVMAQEPTPVSTDAMSTSEAGTQSWPWPWPWPWPTDPKPTDPTDPGTPTTPVKPAPGEDLLKGRDAVDHVHTDAVMVEWKNGGLAINSKVGRDVVSADSVYFNLQKSLHEGRDVSKLTIPDGEEGRLLSFLGKPGETFWAAPGKYYKGWKPIWAGFAADVPDDKINKGSMILDLVRVEGPGWVEVIIHHGGAHDPNPSVHRLMSSRATDFEGRTHRMHMNRYHMHATWVFGKPGTYNMVFKVSGKTPDGETIESEEENIIWQVGPKK